MTSNNNGFFNALKSFKILYNLLSPSKSKAEVGSSKITILPSLIIALAKAILF